MRHRTNIYLDSAQCEALDREAAAAGVSRAEIIRGHLDRALGRSSQDLERDLSAIDASFGALRGEVVVLDRGPGAREHAHDALADR